MNFYASLEVLNLTPSFLGIDIIVRRLGVAPMVAFVLLTKYTSVIDASHIAFLSHTVFTYLVTDFGDEIGVLRLLWSTSVSLCPYVPECAKDAYMVYCLDDYHSYGELGLILLMIYFIRPCLAKSSGIWIVKL